MQIGEKAPEYRIPAFINRSHTSIPLSFFRPNFLFLCCGAKVAEPQISFIETLLSSVRSSHAVMAALEVRDPLLRSLDLFSGASLRIPLLTDPLGRLTQCLAVPKTLPPPQGVTLFFDDDGRLLSRVLHDWTHRGFVSIVDILERWLFQSPPTVAPAAERRTQFSPAS